jgi:hypothetical protein
MKLSTRYIAFAVALGVSGAASAQLDPDVSLEIYFAYGNEHLVQLNRAAYFPGGPTNPAAAIGSQVTGVLRVPQTTDIIDGTAGLFRLQVRVRNTSATARRLQSGVFFMGVGQADDVLHATNATAATFPAWTARSPILHPGLTFGTLGTVRTFNGDVRPNLGNDAARAANPFVRYGTAALGGGVTFSTFRTIPAPPPGTLATRVVGYSFAHGFRDSTGADDADPVSNQIQILPGEDLLLLTVNLRNHGLAAWDTFGDGAGENGLSLNVGTGAPLTHNFYFANRRMVAPADLDLQAVPEPATLLALGAGLAAVAARRRRKS